MDNNKLHNHIANIKERSAPMRAAIQEAMQGKLPTNDEALVAAYILGVEDQDRNCALTRLSPAASVYYTNDPKMAGILTEKYLQQSTKKAEVQAELDRVHKMDEVATKKTKEKATKEVKVKKPIPNDGKVRHYPYGQKCKTCGGWLALPTHGQNVESAKSNPCKCASAPKAEPVHVEGWVCPKCSFMAEKTDKKCPECGYEGA